MRKIWGGVRAHVCTHMHFLHFFLWLSNQKQLGKEKLYLACTPQDTVCHRGGTRAGTEVGTMASFFIKPRTV